MFDVEMENITLAAHEQLSQLEQIVQEKDQLLNILTQRLEQAAEQLDRFRREGVHANYEDPQPAAVEDFASEEPTIRDDLRQMLDDWQRLRDRDWFDQLDQRLTHLLELSNSENRGIQPASHSTAVAESSSKSASGQKVEEESYSSSVAEILARYSKADPGSNPPPATVNEQPAPPRDSVVSAILPREVSAADTVADRMLVPLPIAPEAIDVETANIDQLRAAIVARDAYISQLQEYLHTMDGTAQAPVLFPSLELLSPHQQSVLDDWSESIRKEFRQTQIQISLERAQLSRETMKLQNQQQIIDREMRRLELAKRAIPGGPDDFSEATESSKSRSWLGLFGTK